MKANHSFHQVMMRNKVLTKSRDTLSLLRKGITFHEKISQKADLENLMLHTIEANQVS